MEQVKDLLPGVLSESLKKEQPTNIKTCPQHGSPIKYREIATTPGKSFKVPFCSECLNEQEERRAADELIRANQYRAEITSGNIMSIPMRFKGAPVYEKPLGTESIFITGSCGTGKSWMAASMAKRYAIDSNSTAGVWVNFQEMAIKVKTSFRDDTESMDDIIKNVLKQPFLIMDDIGTAKPTESAIETLYMITNQRYERMMQTIYTTNLSLGEMALSYSDRVASRLSDCRQITLTGKDRRVK